MDFEGNRLSSVHWIVGIVTVFFVFFFVFIAMDFQYMGEERERWIPLGGASGPLLSLERINYELPEPGEHSDALSRQTQSWPPYHDSTVSIDWPPQHNVEGSREWPPSHAYASSSTYPPEHEGTRSNTWPPYNHSYSVSNTYPLDHDVNPSTNWPYDHTHSFSIKQRPQPLASGQPFEEPALEPQQLA